MVNHATDVAYSGGHVLPDLRFVLLALLLAALSYGASLFLPDFHHRHGH
jgi:hypothetical protein